MVERGGEKVLIKKNPFYEGGKVGEERTEKRGKGKGRGEEKGGR